MNRLYEGMFLLDANETAKRWNELESQIHGMLERIDGKIQYTERWPAQKLAYEVKGVRKGTYYLTYFNAPTSGIDELRRTVELSEDILRLLVIQEDWLEEEMTRRRESASSRPDPAESETAKESSEPAAASAAAGASGEGAVEKPAEMATESSSDDSEGAVDSTEAPDAAEKSTEE